MRKLALSLPIIFGLSFLMIAGVWMFNQNQVNHESISLKQKFKKPSKSKRIQEALNYRNSLRLNEITGKVEYSDYAKAMKSAADLKKNSSRAGALGIVWEDMGPDNVGGRVRAIVVDKDNPNTIYSGGVGGGMWKSTNKADSWTMISQGLDNYNVASLAQAVDGALYCGTGEGLSQIGGAGDQYHSGNPGNGMYKSTDGGNTWVSLAATVPSSNPGSDWSQVNRIACDPNNAAHLFVVNGGGVYESNDGGETWAVAEPGVGNGNDLQYAADGTTLFASTASRMYRSLDNGATWVRLTTADNNFPNSNINRIEIATAPSNADYVYVSIAASNPFGSLRGIYRSTDKGDSWSVIGQGGSTTFDPFGDNAQGWYDNTIAVVPNDENKIYMGGVTFWSWSASSNWKQADQFVNGFNHQNPRWIHADKHAIVFDGSNPEVMYLGTDGGIFRSLNAASAHPFPTYAFKNKNFNVTQFYSVAASGDGEIMGGSQDNGTQFLDYQGNTSRSTFEVSGGDGAYCDISLIKPEVFIASIYFSEVFRSGNSGASFGGFFDLEIDNDGDGQPDCGNSFIAYSELHERFEVDDNIEKVTFVADRDYILGENLVLNSNENGYPFNYTLQAALSQGDTLLVNDKVDAKFFLATGNCGLWMTPDILDLSAPARWFRIASGLGGTVFDTDLSPDGNTLYIGVSNGRIYKVEGLATFDYESQYPDPGTSTPPVPSGLTRTQLENYGGSTPITGIAIDPNDPDHIIATAGGYGPSANIYRSTDGNNFSSIQTNLPDMPIYDAIIDESNANNYIIGTELGFWGSNDGGLSWGEENDGLNKVAVYRVRQVPLFEDGCPVIYAGTHGRGFTRTTSLTPDACKTSVGIEDIASNNPAEILDIMIYPNPVSTSGKVRVTTDKQSDIQVAIIDMPGRMMNVMEYDNQPAGQNEYTFDVQNLPAGNYLMVVNVDGQLNDSRIFMVSK